MNRRFRAWVDSPRNAIVTVAYQVVALLVTIVGLISRQWRRMTQYSIKCCLYIRRKRGNGNGAYSKGKRPKEPRVLGVVLFQRSFRAQENQALSRLLTWAAQHGFVLCTLYCPYDGIHVHIDSIKSSMKWSDVPENAGEERSIRVWDGWDAPSDWIDALHQFDKGNVTHSLSSIPMGVALLAADHAEAPFTDIVSKSEDLVDRALERDGVLEKALQAPAHLKEIVSKVAGQVATMDPDIIMIFGGISSLGGYPSWSTRSSEIYDMGPLGVVTRGKLDAAMKRYRVTKQRFGR